MDEAGNHSAVLGCGSPEAPTLLLGSHLDSVPDGGRFDGALGVAAALEVLCCLKDAGVHLPVNVEAIDFTDEEGTLLGVLGSAALAGSLTAHDLTKTHGGQEHLRTILDRVGLSVEGILHARRPPESLAGYLELHIEQGARLHNSGVQIGVVSGIAGICTFQMTFRGRADHSGTTEMSARRDAALGAAAYILAVRQTVVAEFPGCVANVVWLRTLRGALNIVSHSAELGLEFRAADPQDFQKMEKSLIELAEMESAHYDLAVEATRLSRHQPTFTSPAVQDCIRRAAQGSGFSTQALPSGAWHDAQMLAPICPTGMIFIPSQIGSHSPREFAEWQDCLNGANVLLQAALTLVGQPSELIHH